MTSMVSWFPICTKALADLTSTPKAHVPNCTSWWNLPVTVSTNHVPPPAMFLTMTSQSGIKGESNGLVSWEKVESWQSLTDFPGSKMTAGVVLSGEDGAGALTVPRRRPRGERMKWGSVVAGVCQLSWGLEAVGLKTRGSPE
ncbi:hypothetical protein GE09DRAFT_27149 [Coniochaeta sp. 2T2.1]|nr:hypothetical protein GE09DRAFT_27149 [Coniochaeta sp. 2T2.1]